VNVLTQAELVSEEELLEFVRGQRWFGAKGTDVVSLRVVDRVALRDESPLLVDTLVEIRYGTGMHDLYQLLLGVRDDGEPVDGVIATHDGWTAYDSPADPAFARELLHLMRSGSTLAAGDGTIDFCSLGAIPVDRGSPVEARPIGLEQTNSSIVLDDELIVKVYRRLEAGMNPELELLRFFAARDFAQVPRLWGWWSYAGQALNATLGIAQQFARGAVSGWTLALDELPSSPDEFLARTERLGSVLGEMHAVLASESQDPAFCPEEASQESLALLTATVDDEIEQVFLDLPDSVAVAPIVGRGDAVRDLLRGLSSVGSVGKRIRHHGDLHLGQAIWASGDWLIIDFEGEPARPLPQRRMKRSPLRDVAGMLRSFTYAAQVSGLDDPTIEQRARDRFLAGYLEAVRDAGILPAPETTTRLLRIFELEKAVYELRYELAHRPDWVPVPVAGIVRLLEEGS
jgi:trehalose synthase-fused probable maltokinase